MLDGESDGSYSFSDEEQGAELSDVEIADQNLSFSYTLKLVNPKSKSDFLTIKLGTAKKFKSLSSLQQFMYKTISTNPKFKAPDLTDVEMGYIESGHGLKGRKIWLYADGDVEVMYDYFKDSTSILLWCYTEADTQTTKKKKVGSAAKSSKSGTKYGQHLEERMAVDDLYKELQEKHTSYSPRRLRAWANMINMKTWTSLDEPPNKPFFTRGRKRSNAECSTGVETPATKKPPSIDSPGRKVRVRTELIDQLDKFHKLKESGALSSTEYDELRSSILSDIKNL